MELRCDMYLLGHTTTFFRQLRSFNYWKSDNKFGKHNVWGAADFILPHGRREGTSWWSIAWEMYLYILPKFQEGSDPSDSTVNSSRSLQLYKGSFDHIRMKNPQVQSRKTTKLKTTAQSQRANERWKQLSSSTYEKKMKRGCRSFAMTVLAVHSEWREKQKFRSLFDIHNYACKPQRNLHLWGKSHIR